MSRWIKAGIAFPDRMACLTASFRTLEQQVLPWLEKDNPDEIERIVRDLLTKYRPEWPDPVILGLYANFSAMRWEILISHRDLPARMPGEIPAVIPLILEAAPLVVKGGPPGG